MKKDEYQTYCNIVNEINGYTVEEGVAILITVIYTVINNATTDNKVRLAMCKDVYRGLVGLCTRGYKKTKAN